MLPTAPPEAKQALTRVMFARSMATNSSAVGRNGSIGLGTCSGPRGVGTGPTEGSGARVVVADGGALEEHPTDSHTVGAMIDRPIARRSVTRTPLVS